MVAAYTLPIPPEPSSASTRYGPSDVPIHAGADDTAKGGHKVPAPTNEQVIRSQAQFVGLDATLGCLRSDR